MAAVILFLVPIFHGLVFSGLAFWFKKSQKPPITAHFKLALVSAGAGAAANLILCIVLIELLSGLSLIVGQNESSLSASLQPLLLTQPVFVLLVYLVVRAIFKAN